MAALRIPPLYMAAGIAAALAGLYVAANGARRTGEQVGAAVADMASGLLTGAVTAAPEAIGKTAEGVQVWAVSYSNPLKPIGEWIGGKAYDWTH